MLKRPDEHRRYRSIFVSDLHLGTRRVQAQAFIDFLDKTESDYLYIVGDLIDSWSLKKRWYWPKDHNDVFQKLLRKARNGTKIIYIPGNHDENFRDLVGLRLGSIAVVHEAVHLTAKGQRYLVLHGDKFDGVVRFAPWLARLGDAAYELAMSINVGLNWVRRLFRRPYWSLSAFLKYKVKKAVELISRYEEAVVNEAKARQCSGVICGHIHTAEDRMIDGIHYLNDGDWVESCTALVEHLDGSFEIIAWPSSASAPSFESLKAEAAISSSFGGGKTAPYPHTMIAAPPPEEAIFAASPRDETEGLKKHMAIYGDTGLLRAKPTNSGRTDDRSSMKSVNDAVKK